LTVDKAVTEHVFDA